MSILFESTVMHLLDATHDAPILSSTPIALTDEMEAYITSYLTALFDHHSTCHSEFESTSVWKELFEEGVQDFYMFSCDLATQLFAYMKTFPTIPSGDLVVTKFKKDSLPYIAFFKLNYKEAFTHLVDQQAGGAVNTLIKHKAIFPDSISKLQEAALIDLDTLNVLLLDIHKEKYVHGLLGVTQSLTTKQKIKVVENVIAEAIEEHFDNPVEALSFAKDHIARSIDHTQSIMVDQVIQDTFKDHQEIIDSCMQTFEECGLVEPVIEIPQAEKTGKKYASQKIKTNSGIELKLPTQMLHDPERIEFINNPDGTLSILLKNVGALISK